MTLMRVCIVQRTKQVCVSCASLTIHTWLMVPTCVSKRGLILFDLEAGGLRKNLFVTGCFDRVLQHLNVRAGGKLVYQSP